MDTTGTDGLIPWLARNQGSGTPSCPGPPSLQGQAPVEQGHFGCLDIWLLRWTTSACSSPVLMPSAAAVLHASSRSAAMLAPVVSCRPFTSSWNRLNSSLTSTRVPSMA